MKKSGCSLSPGHGDNLQRVLSLKICSAAGVINDDNKLNEGCGRRAPQEMINGKILFLNPCFLYRRSEVNVLKYISTSYIKGRTGEHKNNLEVLLTRPRPPDYTYAQQSPYSRRFSGYSKILHLKKDIQLS